MLYVVAFAILFYVAADHEHLGGARWATYSIGLSILFLSLLPNLVMLFLSQGILFALLWRVNLQKAAKHRLTMRERGEEMRLDRKERLRQAREQLDKGRSEGSDAQAD